MSYRRALVGARLVDLGCDGSVTLSDNYDQTVGKGQGIIYNVYWSRNM